MTRRYRLDDLDLGIMHLLADDARLSNRHIAARLGYTEGTIRARIKKLEQEDCLRFTAITNTAHMDQPILAYIGVHTEQNLIKTVAGQISGLAAVNAVIILLGRFDILAIGHFSSLEHLQRISSNEILALPGVRHIETTISVKVVKYDNRLARIVARREEAGHSAGNGPESSLPARGKACR